MKFSKLIISIFWSLAFMAGFYVIYFSLCAMFAAHFPAIATSTAFGDVLGWIMLGVELMLGLLGLILGLRGKLPGTR